MKTSHKPLKNICKIRAFLGVFKPIKKAISEIMNFSGIQPSCRSEIRPEIAVNMAEFLQFKGVA
jgi:hypothetical protein